MLQAAILALLIPVFPASDVRLACDSPGCQREVSELACDRPSCNRGVSGLACDKPDCNRGVSGLACDNFGWPSTS